MRATVGDRLLIEGHRDSDPRKEAEIVGVRGDDGGPPYVVRWPDGHESVMYPGPDAHVAPSGA